MKLPIGKLLKSKTVWGAILGAGSFLLNSAHIDVATLGQAVGIILGAVGLRDAVEPAKK